MDISKEFSGYVAHLSRALGHADRHAGLSGYCTGLMLPLRPVPGELRLTMMAVST